MLPGIYAGSKTNIPSSNYGWPCNSPVTIHYQIYDRTKFHMVKGIDDAFDHYGIVFCLIKRRVISLKIGLFFQEITLITEFSGSNFLLPAFLAGGKWGFPVR